MKKLLQLLAFITIVSPCRPMEPEDIVQPDEERIWEDAPGISLAQACLKNDAHRAQELLSMAHPIPFSINEIHGYIGEHSYLTFALERGSNAVAQILIDYGASLEPEGTMPAVHWAIHANNRAGTRMLLNTYDCSPNTLWTRFKVTPLHTACVGHGKEREIIGELLLAAGASINAQTSTGATPLHVAAYEAGNGRPINLARMIVSRCIPQRNEQIGIQAKVETEEQAEHSEELVQEDAAKQAEELPASKIKTLKEIALQWLDAHYRELDPSHLIDALHAVDQERYDFYIERPYFAPCLERAEQITLLITCCQKHLDFIKRVVAMVDRANDTARGVAERRKDTIFNPVYIAKLDEIIELLDRVSNAQKFQDLDDLGHDIIKHYAEHFGIWPIELEDFPALKVEKSVDAPQSWLAFFGNMLNTLRNRSGL